MYEPCEPGAYCFELFGHHLALNRHNAPYVGIGVLLFILLVHSYWPRPAPPKPPEPKTPLEAIEREIAEGCANISSTTAGIFVVALFLTLLRPDPTPAVTLFGFYGTHVRSKGSIRSFWVFLTVTLCVDVIWLIEYSPLRPIAWEQLQTLSRKEQLAVTFSGLNAFYKIMAIYSAMHLQGIFEKREAMLAAAGGEAKAEEGTAKGTTSSGEPLDSRSLAAQEAGTSQGSTSQADKPPNGKAPFWGKK